MSHWSDRYAGSPESRDQFGGLYSPLWSSNVSRGVSKISEIQTCWFNTVGYETFENVSKHCVDKIAVLLLTTHCT